MMRRHIMLATASLLLSFHVPVFAGGPMVLEGRDGHTPVTYQNPNIIIHAESGGLGGLPNAAVNILVQEAFDRWNEVESATVTLTIDSTQIDTDINVTNFDQFLPSTDQATLNAEDNLNPLVYDEGGELIDAYFGEGQSDFTAGFAASILTVGSPYFDEGYAVISDKILKPGDMEFKLLISHEIGHFIGLDHSQGNIDNTETDFGSPHICSTSAADNYPLMYPFICRDIDTLHSDDIIAVSALYPGSDIDSRFGILHGRFVDENKQPILGANIWVQNTSTGENYSIVSDYLKQGTGFFMLYLPAGNYSLHANSINTQFNSVSGVGPYASSILDQSFDAPHPITDVSYQGLTAGSDETFDINTGESTEINFSVSGVAVTLGSGTQEDDTVADLFGAVSLHTLWLLAVLPLLARRYCRLSSNNS